ncbi:MAG: hypothetical protein JW860_16055 [Sedimentisphaerales bacterium]|nr:hypothetical protein [Sedimentisphaerales bacterium]
MNSKKVVASIVLVLIVCCGTGWAKSQKEDKIKNKDKKPGLTTKKINENEISLSYEFTHPSYESKNAAKLLYIEGLELYRNTGMPIVPVRPVKIAIPYGKKAVQVSVIEEESRILEGRYWLPPGQKAVPLSYNMEAFEAEAREMSGAKDLIDPFMPNQLLPDKAMFLPEGNAGNGSAPAGLPEAGNDLITPPDPAIYKRDAFWPDVVYKIQTTQSKRGYQLLNVNLFPIQYKPTTGEVKFIRKMRVVVQLDKEKKQRILRPLKKIKKGLQSDVDNPESIESYPDQAMIYTPSGSLSISSDISSVSLGESGGAGGEMMTMGYTPIGPIGDCPGVPSGGYRYLIITTEDMVDPCTIDPDYNFQTLCDSKIARGISAGIVNVEWIYENYPKDEMETSLVSDPNAYPSKMRKFLIDAYNTWDNLEYVLIGGAYQVIPAQRFFVASGYLEDGRAYGTATYMPVDMYFACLDGTFNDNGNTYYGEATDGPDGGDVDLYAELFVGRAAVEDVTELSNFIYKTLTHESSQADYLNRVASLGEWLGFMGDSEFAKGTMEQMRLGGYYDGYTTRGFEQYNLEDFETEGNLPGEPNSDWPLYDQEEEWAKEDLLDLMNGGVHVFNHLGHANQVYCMKLNKSELTNLTNTDYFFVYSQGCLPGAMDFRLDCFAEVITTQEYGAFAVIMNARYGWGQFMSTDGPSNRYARQFWDAILAENIINIGRANQDSKEDNAWDINGDCMRWCYYELNLFGDPETWVFPRPVETPDIAMDQDVYGPSSTIEILLTDEDLAGQSSEYVEVTTSGGDSETILVEEIAPDEIGLFLGTIDTAGGTIVQDDGILQVSHGVTITASYDDGQTVAETTAGTDCQGPQISDIAVDASGSIPVITFETDEPAWVILWMSDIACGSYNRIYIATLLKQNHIFNLGALNPNTTYYFKIQVRDQFNNSTVDDNNGQCYNFTTVPLLVNIDVPNDYETIQEAIDHAWDGDTIWVADGVYSSTGNYDIDFHGRDITVRSENGPESCVIDCQNLGRGFIFHSYESSDAIVQGFSIINGIATSNPEIKEINRHNYGGGIYIENSDPIINNCIINNNKAPARAMFYGYGGAVYACNSEITLENCILNHNQADYGGGCYVESGTLNLSACEINNHNILAWGGSIYLYNSNMHAADSVLQNNRAYGCSGIYFYPFYPGISSLANCIIRDNIDYNASGYGGGMWCAYQDIDITDCMISGNTSAEMAGINFAVSTVRLSNCIIADNTATETGTSWSSGRGGGIYSQYSDIGLINCTVTDNQAQRGAGILSVYGSYYDIPNRILVENSIFWENTGEEGKQFYLYSPASCDPNYLITLAVGTSDIDGGQEDIYLGDPCNPNNLEWLSGNIDADPCFALDDDYHITGTSPCIDTGTNDPCYADLPLTDYEGTDRPLDGDGDETEIADMGAYEYDNTQACIALSRTIFSFAGTLDGPDPTSQILSIRNSGPGVLYWQISESCPWLTVNPDSGSSNGEIDQATISIDKSSLSRGRYEYDIEISDNQAVNSPRVVKIILELAGTMYVPADYPSIGLAVHNAFDGEEIIIADGVYTGDGNRDILLKGKAITIRSANGPENCIIDCDGGAEIQHCAFICNDNEGEDTIFDGLTITRGNGHNLLASVSYGRGEKRGGGIYCYYSHPTIKNCIFTDNGSHLIGNPFRAAEFHGGGIGCYSGYPRVENCIFYDNQASGMGGAFYAGGYEKATPLLINCLFYNNQAGYGGGVAFSWKSWPTNMPGIFNCTIVNNESENDGSGLYLFKSGPIVKNCIIWGNEGKDVYYDPTTSYADPLFAYCDIEGSGGSSSWDTSIGQDGGGNIDTDPLLETNQRLTINSPCIDAGTDAGVYDDMDRDLRPYDVPGIDNNGSEPEFDMGADEHIYMLSSYWPFDEGTGSTVYDSSGNIDGEIYGAQWVTGRAGYGLEFYSTTGTDGKYVEIEGLSDMLLGTDYTVSWWARPDSLSLKEVILLGEDYTVHDFEFYQNNGYLDIRADYGSGDDINIPNVFVVDEWVHICVVGDADGTAVYINGEPEANTEVTKSSSTGYNLYIGAYGDGRYGFNGIIDEVRVYNRALTPSEVTSLFLDVDWSSYWPLDEGAGSIVYDNQGDYDGIITGAQWTTGKFDYALEFASSGDKVILSSMDVLQGDEVTITAWIYGSDFSSDYYYPIVTQYDQYDNGYYLYIFQGGYPAFYIGGPGYLEAISSVSIDTDDWYHIAGANDGTSIKIYVNGLEKDSETSTGLSGVDHSAYIGFDDYYGTFDGIIDDVRIYSRALNEDEIAALAAE